MHTHRFDTFLRFLIRWEGATNPIGREDTESIYLRATPFAFSKHPKDPGGATMMGITMRVFTVWRTAICKQPRPTETDLRSMPYAEWENIVRYLYWQPLRADTLPFDCFNIALADWHFHSGATAIRHAQTLLGTEPDGYVGRKTINAAKRAMPTRERARLLATQLTETRRAWLQALALRQPQLATFAQGWDNRINALLFLFQTLDLTEEEERAHRRTAAAQKA